MPKDPRKNIDRYKIDGGQLNEFEFQQSQEELAAREPQAEANLIPGTPPEAAKSVKATKGTKSTKGAKATKVTRTAKSRKSIRATKSTKGTKTVRSTKATKAKKVAPPRGASAKKLAARKAAKK